VDSAGDCGDSLDGTRRAAGGMDIFTRIGEVMKFSIIEVDDWHNTTLLFTGTLAECMHWISENSSRQREIWEEYDTGVKRILCQHLGEV
jgi:hypothetical protein